MKSKMMDNLSKEPGSLPAHVIAVSDFRKSSPPEITFIVPVYNEKENVVQLLDRILALPLDKDVVVIDDGSTDGSRDLLKNNVRKGMGLWFHQKNLGKGAAVQTALRVSRGEFAAIQDADLEYDPSEYQRLLETIKNKKVDVVYGSRFMKKNPTLYLRFYLGNKVLTWFINLLCWVRMTDTYTCFKLMRLNQWECLGLESRGFEMEAEIAVKVALRRLTFAEVAIDYHPRSLLDGKKIGWRDAIKGICAVVRFWTKELTV